MTQFLSSMPNVALNVGYDKVRSWLEWPMRFNLIHLANDVGVDQLMSRLYFFGTGRTLVRIVARIQVLVLISICAGAVDILMIIW